MKKVSLILPDGVGIRNFVLSPFLRVCGMEVEVLHNCPDEVVGQLSRNLTGVSWRRLPGFRDTPMSYTLRQALTYAHVYWGDTLSMRYTRSRKATGSWRTRAANHAARAVGRLSATKPGLKVLEGAYWNSVARLAEVDEYRKIFQASKPQVVVSGNHRLPNATAPILAARSLGIPTATFVASWDNLTSKGRVSAPFDWFLVWSEHMKGELLQFYPGIKAEQVHVVGTPQFDSYGDPGILWGREEFLKRCGASPDRPLICYSGGDEGTCPEDHLHLRVLLEAIRDGRIQHNPQVLLRPSPVDPCTRYEQLRKDFPELIFARPQWLRPSSGEWSDYLPLPEDVQFLANLTEYADLNVNIASTMTLDFGMHDRPVVNIGYDIGSPPPLKVPLGALFYTWEHYAPVVKLGAAKVAFSPDELCRWVNEYLENPSADREGRKRLFDLQVGAPLGDSSRRIADVLRKVAK